MRMLNDLARMLAIVHRDVDAVGLGTFLYRERERACQLRNGGPIFRFDIEDVL